MDNILSWILFIPTIAALVLLFFPGEQKGVIRWAALIASLIPFVLTLVAWTQVDFNTQGTLFALE